MNNFNERYQHYLTLFETELKNYCDGLPETSKPLKDAMVYSVMLGGKRVRPVLMLATADILNVALSDVMPFSIALEMIHTYSLIHDDLPAMDNDDFRRGKPSNHKVYGEALAILAGDGLLNHAYDLCFQQCFKGEKFIRAASYLCQAAGEKGMIAGQVKDILCSKESFDEETLDFIYTHKTGKLLEAPIAIASILADDEDFTALDDFAKSLGRLFQLTDDILDVTGQFDKLGKTIGKDQVEDKATCIKLYGLDEALLKADLCVETCTFALERIDKDVEFLKDMVYFVRNRQH